LSVRILLVVHKLSIGRLSVGELCDFDPNAASPFLPEGGPGKLV